MITKAFAAGLLLILVHLFAEVQTQDELKGIFDNNSSAAAHQTSPLRPLPLHITNGIPKRNKCPERHFFSNGRCHPILYRGEKKCTACCMCMACNGFIHLTCSCQDFYWYIFIAYIKIININLIMNNLSNLTVT